VTRAELDVDALLGSIDIIREGGRNPAEVFATAGVNDVSDEELLAVVRAALRRRPDLVQTWQGWSYDKRWSPSPYLDDLEVGHYAAGRQRIRRHADAVNACADFVVAEVRWVVDKRVVQPR
jgi:hypothetical protein